MALSRCGIRISSVRNRCLAFNKDKYLEPMFDDVGQARTKAFLRSSVSQKRRCVFVIENAKTTCNVRHGTRNCCKLSLALTPTISRPPRFRLTTLSFLARCAKRKLSYYKPFFISPSLIAISGLHNK